MRAEIDKNRERTETERELWFNQAELTEANYERIKNLFNFFYLEEDKHYFRLSNTEMKFCIKRQKGVQTMKVKVEQQTCSIDVYIGAINWENDDMYFKPFMVGDNQKKFVSLDAWFSVAKYFGENRKRFEVEKRKG